MTEAVGDPLNTIEASIALLSRSQRRALEAQVADMGLNLTQSIVTSYLAFIASNGDTAPLNQTELADRLNLRKPATGAAIDVLEARGIVARVPAPDDRRAFLIEITDHGRVGAVEIEGRMNAARAAIERGITESDIAIFSATVAKILSNIEDLDRRSGGGGTRPSE